MAYTDGSMVGGLIPEGTGVVGVETVSAAAAVHGSYLVMKQVKISRLEFFVTVAIAANVTAPVVRLIRRPTYGSTSGQVVLGTLTLPDLTAAGKIVYKDIAPVVLNPGETLTLEHVTQAADGSVAAGAGYYGFRLEGDPEIAGNQSKMIASA